VNSTDDSAAFRILLVDDNARNLQLLGHILNNASYPTAFALDGKRALEMLAADRYDLVLLDVMMPGMDGFEVCRRMKSDRNTREIPVIFLTARTEPDSVVAGFEAGAVDYVTKPFHARELLARVSTQERLRAAERERIDRETLQAILELAGAVCHEFNQPLQIISGTVELMRHREDIDPSTLGDLKRVMDAVERLGGLTRKLSGITRRETREYLSGTRILDLEKSARQTRANRETDAATPDAPPSAAKKPLEKAGDP
jgi:DNA-binding response OmpR family regulator